MKPPRRAVRFAILGVLPILLPSCTTLPPLGTGHNPWVTVSRLKPGGGRKATIIGHSYDEIWMAAYTVADEHFEIREQDKASGVIKAERTQTFWGIGAVVGIYIDPPKPGVDQYVVEVVSLKQALTWEYEQDWEKKVLRDLQRVLAGEPIR